MPFLRFAQVYDLSQRLPFFPFCYLCKFNKYIFHFMPPLTEERGAAAMGTSQSLRLSRRFLLFRPEFLGRRVRRQKAAALYGPIRGMPEI